MDLYLTNKMYVSNTITRNNYFLPNISGFVTFEGDWIGDDPSVKLIGSYNRFNSELSYRAGPCNKQSVAIDHTTGVSVFPCK